MHESSTRADEELIQGPVLPCRRQAMFAESNETVPATLNTNAAILCIRACELLCTWTIEHKREASVIREVGLSQRWLKSRYEQQGLTNGVQMGPISLSASVTSINCVSTSPRLLISIANHSRQQSVSLAFPDHLVRCTSVGHRAI